MRKPDMQKIKDRELRHSLATSGINTGKDDQKSTPICLKQHVRATLHTIQRTVTGF